MNTDNLTIIGDDSSNSVVVLSVNGAPSLSASELRTDLNRINTGAQLKRSIDTCPLRIAFSIQYTDFGVETLYSELESLQSDLERSRHIKRVLMDIYQGSFNRPAARDSATTAAKLSRSISGCLRGTWAWSLCTKNSRRTKPASPATTSCAESFLMPITPWDQYSPQHNRQAHRPTKRLSQLS